MHFKMLSAICFNLDQSKILLSDNGLSHALANKDNASKQYIFLFSQAILFPLPDKFMFWVKFNMFHTNSTIFWCGKELTRLFSKGG